MTQPSDPRFSYPPLQQEDHCSFCRRPLLGASYRVQGQAACPDCAARLGSLLELNQFQFGPWALGLVYGLAAAVLCGFVWAIVAKLLDAEIGIVAIGAAYIVTRAIIAGTNGRRGQSVQILAVVCSIISIYVGKGLTFAWALWDKFPKEQLGNAPEWLMRILVFVTAPFLTFRVFDLVWYVLAIMQSWRQAQPIRLRIEGPFGVGANAPPSMPMPQHFPQQQQAYEPTQPAPQQDAPRQPRSPSLIQSVALTLVSAVISVAVYANEDGWKFAAGFVLCILIHELGHTVACVLYGMRASAPIFVPYMGAVILLRQNPPNAKVEAVIGIAGPVGGLVATLACFGWYLKTHSELSASLTQFSALINLLNLIPIHPLDGGRIARGIANQSWGLVALFIVALFSLAPRLGIRQGVLIVVAALTAVGTFRTMQAKQIQRGEYFNQSAVEGWTMGIAYVALAGVLMWLWAQVRNAGTVL
jgi:Zn-dependent protease